MAMARPATDSIARPSAWPLQAGLVIAATGFVALCARLTVPLPFTPVPLTLQNFAVLVVGLALGSRRGFLALVLYLAEGLAGAPVFNPTGPGGLAQLLGPTGGYLLAYPLVAFVAGFVAERGRRSFWRATIACALGEALLFAAGISWLALVTPGSWLQAVQFGLYPFVFAEAAKISAAAGISMRLPRAQAAVNNP